MRKMIVGMATAVLLATGMSACGGMPQACANLSVTERDRQAAADGYDVEKVDAQGNECELSQDGNSWSVDH